MAKNLFRKTVISAYLGLTGKKRASKMRTLPPTLKVWVQKSCAAYKTLQPERLTSTFEPVRFTSKVRFPSKMHTTGTINSLFDQLLYSGDRRWGLRRSDLRSAHFRTSSVCVSNISLRFLACACRRCCQARTKPQDITIPAKPLFWNRVVV